MTVPARGEPHVADRATVARLADDWATLINRQSERASAMVEGLSEQHLNWTPPSGGWSMAQVFSHLAITAELYLGQIRSALARVTHSSAAAQRAWRPSLAGRFIRGTLRSRRRAPTPRVFRPADERLTRADSVDAFLRTQRELLVELNRARTLDISRIRTRSPASPLLRLNLGDCFELTVVHTERHLAQAARVRAEPGFPL